MGCLSFVFFGAMYIASGVFMSLILLTGLEAEHIIFGARSVIVKNAHTQLSWIPLGYEDECEWHRKTRTTRQAGLQGYV